MALFLDSQSQPFRQCSRKVGLKDLFLGFSDVVFDPVEIDLLLFAVVDSTGSPGVPIPWLSH